MTDVDAANGAPAEPLSPQIRIAAQFTRDLSFESPRAPESLRSTAQPEIEIGAVLPDDRLF